MTSQPMREEVMTKGAEHAKTAHKMMTIPADMGAKVKKPTSDDLSGFAVSVHADSGALRLLCNGAAIAPTGIDKNA